jgi:hypothetical protein
VPGGGRQGHYAFIPGGLTAGVTHPPLVALPGANGVYSYGLAPQVPLTAAAGADYGVDVDFSPTFR